MKNLQYLLVCILIFTIVACSSKNNDITNPISNANLNDNNGNNAKIITTSYTINGIDEKYNGTWKFFNADDTGNIAVDVTIADGGVGGLVISNSKSQNKVSFTKDNIYSRPTKEDNQYYNHRYFGYIISDGTWVGELHFPIYDETVGYVYIKNRNNNNLIVGMIDKAPGEKEGINEAFYGTRVNDENGIKRTLIIDKSFVTYSEDDIIKVKIPSCFFEGSSIQSGTIDEYTIFQGLLYSGVWINALNTENSSILPSLYFEYYDYNYILDIILGSDNRPISAVYNKKQTTISPGDILYRKIK
ncbi:hypothetical protein R4J18_07905 [Brachyspira pilosicoli]|uniref:hypothetical protein n=1 Tax=Brachyspira pilosicoli TaxID=52584 RepID=UPI003006B6E2